MKKEQTEERERERETESHTCEKADEGLWAGAITAIDVRLCATIGLGAIVSGPLGAAGT